MVEPRARDLGIRIGLLEPGPHNAITDVPGVRVGHTTLISGDGPLVVGQGPVRTGVTVIVPGGEPFEEAFFAGCHRLNGNGELTGLEWVRESGMLTTPIAITNTHSVGRRARRAHRGRDRAAGHATASGHCRWWARPTTGASTTWTASTSARSTSSRRWTRPRPGRSRRATWAAARA